ncbi:MAG: HAMP domain-containing sensor histidine kinase [Bacillota bacterium]|nr:HAMP domain-containing sensor histidine kinase [Bacillota bacterium]
MKRIVSLRAELVIIAALTIVFSFFVGMIAKGFGVASYSKSPDYRMNYIYSGGVAPVEKKLKKENMSDPIELQKFLDKEGSFEIGYNLCITDSEGNVIAASNKDVKKIDRDKIQAGGRHYAVSPDNNEGSFKVDGCDYLKEGYYLYYSYLGYGKDDQLAALWALVGFVILFLILIWRRVSYISRMKSAVNNIAEGNLSYRVPLKYRDELRELAEGINYMASELENEEKKRNEFLTNISHDLRTPLTTILGYIDMIKKEKYDSKEEMAKYINVMERKGVFLRKMLEDFFQYSKLASKDIELNFSRIELNEVGRQVFEDECTAFEEKRLKLSLKLSQEPIYTEVDQELFIRAISNLISNALKYSKADTTVMINVSGQKLNNLSYGVFSISNVPKEPISKEELISFFERLYKKDKARHEEGSGLGLSIVKDIVELHGGNVKGTIEGERLIIKINVKINYTQ